MRSARPKIEVIRLPSSEHAKLRPLLEAEFQHLRCGDYASYRADSLYRLREDDLSSVRKSQRVCHTAPPLATKSCDNIFARQVACERERQGPFLWRDATRSEEVLCCSSQGHRQPLGHASSTRSRLTALLKKLSPRPRRPPPPQPAPCPWVLVEFSAQDLEPGRREGSRDSTTSDKSFDMAVREAVLRKEKAARQQSAATATLTTTTTKTLVAPTILIGTPECSSRQPSTPSVQDRPSSSSSQRGSPSSKHRPRQPRGPRAAAPLRPHTLLIQSPAPRASNLAPQSLGCKMASFESIGSCSLDAYATASEVSEVAGANDDLASEKTLRSESFSVPSPPVKSSGGASTPEYVKRTARLFETPGTKLSAAAAPPSVVLTNGTGGDGLVNGGSGKKPSYLGLACSISGYSGITTYDSKLREGFRSRDHSPGRLGLVRSRDVSPLRPDGGPESLPACFKSECGNYLVAPTKIRTVEKSISLSGSPLRVPDTDRLRTYMNGGDVGNKLVVGTAHINGTMDETDKSSTPVSNGILNSESERKTFELNAHESFSDATSHIRESSRNFMSSMLNSAFPTQFESSSAKSKEPHVVSSSKTSPIASQSHDALSAAVKSDSKDSLSPPVALSPQKRSPGAVRVVEFTSQPKSYVRTVVSSRSLFMSSASVDSALPPPQASAADPGPGRPVSGTVSETAVSGGTNGNASKSFIQQRVERLYGPGALAQGFFRRTRESPRLPDYSVQIPDASSATVAPRTCISSPSLPVLRHLRPEFRAQLSLTTPRRLQLDGTASRTDTIFSPMALQQQVSVESVAESLPDLQPAAPEVVLPPEQTQPPPLEPANATAEEQAKEKDGHYFLKLLKQEIERLNGLVEGAEQLLACGETLPEEALGKLRAASGQARLLVRQKLQQFEGLCHKNIAQSPGEPFPTTSLDLQGFWDMVYLQVDHVHRLFEEIDRLKRANWVEEQAEKSDVLDGAMAGAPKRRSGSKRVSSKSTVSEETRRSNEAARKAREEDRRKMMEQRRRALREKKNQTGSVEIFIPHENAQGSAV